MTAEPPVDKQRRAEAMLRACDRVIVAFSGGVDSAFLLYLARRVLGRERVLAVTAVSASLAAADLDDCARLARELDVELRVITTDEVSNPAYQANTSARCFFCKQELFDQLAPIAQEFGASAVLYGAIRDDLDDDRRGALAARQAGARAPLQDAGLFKWEIRELARAAGLSVWNKPQNACLSSRIPHGRAVTPEKLRQIEQAEAFLKSLGFTQVRVRHLGDRARIEVGKDEVARFDDAALCQRVAEQFAAIGFASVSMDPEGYRPGGADRVIAEKQLRSSECGVRNVATRK